MFCFENLILLFFVAFSFAQNENKFLVFNTVTKEIENEFFLEDKVEVSAFINRPTSQILLLSTTSNVNAVGWWVDDGAYACHGKEIPDLILKDGTRLTHTFSILRQGNLHGGEECAGKDSSGICWNPPPGLSNNKVRLYEKINCAFGIGDQIPFTINAQYDLCAPASSTIDVSSFKPASGDLVDSGKDTTFSFLLSGIQLGCDDYEEIKVVVENDGSVFKSDPVSTYSKTLNIIHSGSAQWYLEITFNDLSIYKSDPIPICFASEHFFTPVFDQYFDEENTIILVNDITFISWSFEFLCQPKDYQFNYEVLIGSTDTIDPSVFHGDSLTTHISNDDTLFLDFTFVSGEHRHLFYEIYKTKVCKSFSLKTNDFELFDISDEFSWKYIGETPYAEAWGTCSDYGIISIYLGKKNSMRKVVTKKSSEIPIINEKFSLPIEPTYLPIDRTDLIWNIVAEIPSHFTVSSKSKTFDYCKSVPPNVRIVSSDKVVFSTSLTYIKLEWELDSWGTVCKDKYIEVINNENEPIRLESDERECHIQLFDHNNIIVKACADGVCSSSDTFLINPCYIIYSVSNESFSFASIDTSPEFRPTYHFSLSGSLCGYPLTVEIENRSLFIEQPGNYALEMDSILGHSGQVVNVHAYFYVGRYNNESVLSMKLPLIPKYSLSGYDYLYYTPTILHSLEFTITSEQDMSKWVFTVYRNIATPISAIGKLDGNKVTFQIDLTQSINNIEFCATNNEPDQSSFTTCSDILPIRCNFNSVSQNRDNYAPILKYPLKNSKFPTNNKQTFVFLASKFGWKFFEGVNGFKVFAHQLSTNTYVYSTFIPYVRGQRMYSVELEFTLESLYKWGVCAISNSHESCSPPEEQISFSTCTGKMESAGIDYPENGEQVNLDKMTFRWFNYGIQCGTISTEFVLLKAINSQPYKTQTLNYGETSISNVVINEGDSAFWNVKYIVDSYSTSSLLSHFVPCKKDNPPKPFLISPEISSWFEDVTSVELKWGLNQRNICMDGLKFLITIVNGKNTKTVTTQSYSHKIDKPNGETTWSVKAMTDFGSTESDEFFFISCKDVPPSAPDLISPSEGMMTSETKITFMWKDTDFGGTCLAEGAEFSYTLYCDGDAVKTTEKVSFSPSIQRKYEHTLSDLKKHTWQVSIKRTTGYTDKLSYSPLTSFHICELVLPNEITDLVKLKEWPIKVGWSGGGCNKCNEVSIECTVIVKFCPKSQTKPDCKTFQSKGTTLELTARSLEDGEYDWTATAVSVFGSGPTSKSKIIEICNRYPPQAPSLVSEQQYFTKTQSSSLDNTLITFEVNKVASWGSSCVSSKNRFILQLNGEDISSADEPSTETTVTIEIPLSIMATIGQKMMSIVAINGDGEKTSSAFVYRVCMDPQATTTEQPDGSELFSTQGTFFWASASNKVGYPCSGSFLSRLYLVIDSEADLTNNEDDEDDNNGDDDDDDEENERRQSLTPSSVRAVLPSSASYVSAIDFDFILAPNTKYYWSILVSNGETSISSEVRSFTTRPFSCFELDCVHGTCVESTTSLHCECQKGYSGDNCALSDTSKVGIIVGIVVAAVVVILIAGLGSYYVYRKRRTIRKFSFPVPIYNELRFIRTNSRTETVDNAIMLIDSDPKFDFTRSHLSLSKCPADELDNLILSYLYVFHQQGCALDFVKIVFSAEIGSANSTKNLFRENSLATKVFYQYARLIALPYLFESYHAFLERIINELMNSTSFDLKGINSSYSTDSHIYETGTELDVSIDKALLEFDVALFIQRLAGTIKKIPRDISSLLGYVREEISNQLPDEISITPVSFLFIKFILSSFITSSKLGVFPMNFPGNEIRSRLANFGKLLSHVVLNTPFEGESSFNEFIESSNDEIQTIFLEICSTSRPATISIPKPLNTTSHINPETGAAMLASQTSVPPDVIADSLCYIEKRIK